MLGADNKPVMSPTQKQDVGLEPVLSATASRQAWFNHEAVLGWTGRQEQRENSFLLFHVLTWKG